MNKQLLVLLASTLAYSSAQAVDVADSELGLLLGGAWGSDRLTGGGNNGKVNPLIGLRASTTFGSDFNFFGDLTYVKYQGSNNFDSDGLRIGDSKVTTLRGGAEWFVFKEPKYNWFLAGAAGAIHVSREFNSSEDFTRPQLSAGIGQVWGVGALDSFRWELRLDQTLGNGNLRGAWLTNYQALLGYSWGFGKPADFDGDGVPNRMDQCPSTPRGATVDAKGCPTDSDGDGVYDGLDKCPNTPAGVKVNEDGCPLDSDGDGVPDNLDKCPDTPAGAKVNADGCPLDSDGDGVPDYLDKCPDTPAGAKVDANGCPPPAAAAPEPAAAAPKPMVLDGVNFHSNSAKLTRDSYAILDKAAETIKEWGDVKVEVAGYTDAVGSKASNLALSKRRANAVRAYLISKGVDAKRLIAKGYGESKPVADNKTAKGRAMNRHVVLVPLQ